MGEFRESDMRNDRCPCETPVSKVPISSDALEITWLSVLSRKSLSSSLTGEPVSDTDRPFCAVPSDTSEVVSMCSNSIAVWLNGDIDVSLATCLGDSGDTNISDDCSVDTDGSVGCVSGGSG